MTSTVASLIVLIVRENLMSALAMERSAAEARANGDFIVLTKMEHSAGHGWAIWV